jgi:threonine dehydrogenase-like Zn-dependent dehydrogenase
LASHIKRDTMQQLVLVGLGQLRWDGVAYPTLMSDAAAVLGPIAVATSDSDIGVLRGRYPLPGPNPIGHDGVAEVVAVGDDVPTVAVCDVVVVPFQISCATCSACVG